MDTLILSLLVSMGISTNQQKKCRVPKIGNDCEGFFCFPIFTSKNPSAIFGIYIYIVFHDLLQKGQFFSPIGS